MRYIILPILAFLCLSTLGTSAQTSSDAEEIVWEGPNRYMEVSTGRYFDDLETVTKTYIDRATNATYWHGEYSPFVKKYILNQTGEAHAFDHKRQVGPPFAFICTNSNGGGTCTTLNGPVAVWNTMPAGYDKTVSSIYFLTAGWYMSVYTEQNLQGTEWVFCGYDIPNLSPFGVLNDKIRSVAFVYSGTGSGMFYGNVALFSDTNYLGKYICCPIGAWLDMNCAINGAGNFGNDQLSSLVVWPYTNAVGGTLYATLYKDANRQGLTNVASSWSVIPGSPDWVGMYPNMTSFGLNIGNDQVSSIMIQS